VKLSRVEIRGFKSIAKKTALSLADGITCVAGPNGCGKSNIIDAIRWALGEQSARSLRASSMSDVIFSGTQDVGPSSLASVTLELVRDKGYFPATLDGFASVSVTRRLFRSGESEYLINNVKCRLKDVADLFLDTGLNRNGYAIIEQGRVKDIIQAKPDEIRYVIEEAAEVGRFRIKRAEALKRLEATSKNLERIRDLLNEVSRQRNDLKSQSHKARRYQDLRAAASELSKILAACDLLRIASGREALEAELQGCEARIAGYEKDVAVLNEKAHAHEGTGSRLKAEMEKLASSLGAAESRELLARREIESSNTRLKDLGSTIEMLTQGMEEDKRLSEEEQAKALALGQELERLFGELQGILTLVEADEAAHGGLEREYEILEQEYNEKRTELFHAIGEVRSLDQRVAEIRGRHQEVASTLRKRGQDLSSLAASAQNLARDLLPLDAEISSKRGEIPLVQEETQGLVRSLEEGLSRIEVDTQRLIAQEKSLAEIRAKLSVLARIVDPAGSPESTRPHPNGTRKVSDMLCVRAGFEEAVGRSMGPALDFLIFRDHGEILAQDGFETRGPGFVIERPHVGHRVQGPPAGSTGVLGELTEFIDAQDGYRDVAEALSRNMWVVEDLRSALVLWEQGHRSCSFVTRQGMILEPTGAIRTTRELAKYAEVLKAKAEIREFSERMRSLEEQIPQLETGLVEAKKGLQELKARHADRTARLRTLEREMASLQESRGRIVAQQGRLIDQETSLKAEIAQMEALAAKFDAELAALTVQKTALEEDRAGKESLVKELDGRKQAAKQGLLKSQEEKQARATRLSDLKVLQATRGERLRTLEAARAKRLEDIEKDVRRIEELAHTRLAVELSMGKARETLEGASAEIASMKAAYDRLVTEYETALSLQRTSQEEARTLRSALEQEEKARSEAQLKKREYEIAYAMNLERLSARFGEGMPEIPGAFDAEGARQEVAAIEERIEKMGQINFASIEGFEHVQQRWDDLHRQYEDIVRASTRLKEVIANIERQSIKAFMATFTQVKQNFQEIFTSMFGGGKADIVFTEGDELEAGVEIFASPPFKRLKAMSLLSEGEKTLCAISFMFALFKVNPSPFCILDEVDAPLDDANVIRLNRLIRTFSRDSQFIIVTHNRHTMDMADILYGVTFDVPGISKVVSMVLEGDRG